MQGISEEEQASIALARQLMQEENLRAYEALQQECMYAAMEQRRNNLTYGVTEEYDEDLLFAMKLAEEENNVEIRDSDIDLDQMSHDQIVQLERYMGNVKTDVWKEKASKVIEEKCKATDWKSLKAEGTKFDSVACQICQHDFTDNEKLMVLPCGHTFHLGCVSHW